MTEAQYKDQLRRLNRRWKLYEELQTAYSKNEKAVKTFQDLMDAVDQTMDDLRRWYADHGEGGQG